jgi:hypothetical protein
MADDPLSVLDTRRAQAFPTLDHHELERLRRFGQPRAFAKGEAIAKVGQTGHGLTLIISGEVAITQRDELGHVHPVVTYTPGSFMGELAQLTGRPALTDAHAQSPVEAVVIPPDRLRALLIAEAEIGERIMRALILRRVGLLQTPGAGPIIVGRPAATFFAWRDFSAATPIRIRPSTPRATRRPRPWSNVSTSIPPPCRSYFVRAASCSGTPARTSWPAASAWSAPSIPPSSTTS